MSSAAYESALTSLQVVDLCRVRPTELEAFWEREIRLWNDRLHWDVSAAVSALGRALDRGGLMGKAVRYGDQTAGYCYYVVEGDRGVISGLVVSPSLPGIEVGSALLRAVLQDLHARHLRRIETQFISFDSPWLEACFAAQGFRVHWRDFLRVDVPRSTRPSHASPRGVSLSSWKSWNLTQAAELMQAAHRGGADAAMNELYRLATAASRCSTTS